jgi:hypothetical protein
MLVGVVTTPVPEQGNRQFFTNTDFDPKYEKILYRHLKYGNIPWYDNRPEAPIPHQLSGLGRSTVSGENNDAGAFPWANK